MGQLSTATIGQVSVDISAKYRPTYHSIVTVNIGRPSVGRHIDQHFDQDLANISTDTWPIVPSVGRTSANMSSNARSICQLIHQSTCIVNIGRHIGRYATDMLTDTRQYIDRVSANMSTNYSVGRYVDRYVDRYVYRVLADMLTNWCLKYT